MSLLVKVCGMTRAEDVNACEKLGADFLGFIFHQSSPRNVDEMFARSIKTESAKKVGVFVKQSAAEVARIMDNGALDFAQLHGAQNEEFCKTIGRERVIKALWPQRYESFKEFQDDIDRFAPYCSYMLFDAGSSGGGHGVSMDFDLFKNVTVPMPWLLAGGLSAANLSEALATAKPYGVDLNSGVESAPGIKDKNKLSAAFECIRSNKMRK